MILKAFIIVARRENETALNGTVGRCNAYINPADKIVSIEIKIPIMNSNFDDSKMRCDLCI